MGLEAEEGRNTKGGAEGVGDEVGGGVRGVSRPEGGGGDGGDGVESVALRGLHVEGGGGGEVCGVECSWVVVIFFLPSLFLR